MVGRLGDLGEIDARYDVAASTASSALDYIVVETSLGAQRCVDFLKQRNAGRARFLLLDEMQCALLARLTPGATAPPARRPSRRRRPRSASST